MRATASIAPADSKAAAIYHAFLSPWSEVQLNRPAVAFLAVACDQLDAMHIVIPIVIDIAQRMAVDVVGNAADEAVVVRKLVTEPGIDGLVVIRNIVVKERVLRGVLRVIVFRISRKAVVELLQQRGRPVHAGNLRIVVRLLRDRIACVQVEIEILSEGNRVRRQAELPMGIHALKITALLRLDFANWSAA